MLSMTPKVNHFIYSTGRVEYTGDLKTGPRFNNGRRNVV